MSTGPSGKAPPPSAAIAADALTVVPRKHVSRWIGAALVLAFLIWLGVAMANAAIDWSIVAEYMTLPVLMQGIVTALWLTVVSMALGLLLGIVTAVMRMSKNPVTSTVAYLYIWVFRGTPVYLQLLMWFNIALIFPQLFIPGMGVVDTTKVVTADLAAIIALGLNQGAYTSEVIRSGILSVDEGQSEAASAIGMTRLHLMRRIVLPQAMRVVIPPIGNEVISMVKTTSLASAIGVTEILTQAQHIYYVNSKIMELLIVCAVWYLAATTVMSIGQFYLERAFAKGATSRALPPTPLQKLRAALTGKRS
ncbi:MAG: amino acid ABC transporter permease [Micropruina sp.]|uniref:amino acid ABC transporter permease n=1 Tax=Micropruina sp. TaxID=2737536 RepID=UPI0039E2672F